jgi:hypothetical protein
MSLSTISTAKYGRPFISGGVSLLVLVTYLGYRDYVDAVQARKQLHYIHQRAAKNPQLKESLERVEKDFRDVQGDLNDVKR